MDRPAAARELGRELGGELGLAQALTLHARTRLHTRAVRPGGPLRFFVRSVRGAGAPARHTHTRRRVYAFRASGVAGRAMVSTRIWVGVRRPFHLSVFLPAPRMVLPQDPSTHTQSTVRPLPPARGRVRNRRRIHTSMCVAWQCEPPHCESSRYGEQQGRRAYSRRACFFPCLFPCLFPASRVAVCRYLVRGPDVEGVQVGPTAPL